MFSRLINMPNNVDVSGDGVNNEIKELLRARLSSKQNDVSLFTPMIDALMDTLDSVVKEFEDIEMVSDIDIAGMFDESWERIATGRVFGNVGVDNLGFWSRLLAGHIDVWHH